MARFLFIILFLVAITVCLGLFRGWFSVSSQKTPFSEQREINLKVNPEKFQQDANALEGKTKELFRSGTDADNPSP
jgi:hypothetical protein